MDLVYYNNIERNYKKDMNEAIFLRAKDFAKSYAGNKVLFDVNFEIKAGDIVGSLLV